MQNNNQNPFGQPQFTPQGQAQPAYAPQNQAQPPQFAPQGQAQPQFTPQGQPQGGGFNPQPQGQFQPQQQAAPNAFWGGSQEAKQDFQKLTDGQYHVKITGCEDASQPNNPKVGNGIAFPLEVVQATNQTPPGFQASYRVGGFSMGNDARERAQRKLKNVMDVVMGRPMHDADVADAMQGRVQFPVEAYLTVQTGTSQSSIDPATGRPRTFQIYKFSPVSATTETPAQPF